MSIFDRIKQEDIILAFFPCVRFENQIMLHFRGQMKSIMPWSMEKKIEYDMKLMDELRDNYHTVCKMFLICMRRGLKLIMENPYSEEHFLRRYWCYPPAIIDRDRRESGDYYKKPTQYWFVNCKPQGRVLFEPEEWNAIECKDPIRMMNKDHFGDYANTMKEARSMIHPSYAKKFIRTQILEEET